MNRSSSAVSRGLRLHDRNKSVMTTGGCALVHPAHLNTLPASEEGQQVQRYRLATK